MNILDVALAGRIAAGGGGGGENGTDNYNDLSNLPQINGETLAGNKTAENLGLQDALTFDSAPTEDSTNPVESGGVYNALAGKQDNLTFDDDPTENSTNPVKSGGVYNALAGKQDNLTFDGTYNASTNKAATESTVTNAIAGLDVSALSVDADETISSISETDGKISVTKQDIAIASNQVVAMTGYTKPSSAPATPAIQQGDTANAAIGKLEYKADVNQTNILYALGKTGHNLLEVTATSETVSGVVYTVNKNAITISSNGSNTTSTFVLNSGSPLFKASNNVFAIDKVMPAGATITVKYTDGTIVGFNANNRNTNTTLNNAKDVESIYLYIDANKTIRDTIKVMVCTQDDWEVTHEITPYQGIQNYDLTRLEAEDRAGLVDVVDSGAKNLYDINSSAYIASSPSISYSKDSSKISVSSTANYTYVEYSVPATLSAGNSILSFEITGYTGNTLSMVEVRTTSGAVIATTSNFNSNGNVTCNIILSSSSTIKLRLCCNLASSAIAVSYNVTNIMVCTKAAFGVSNKFVPYRGVIPSNIVLAQTIATTPTETIVPSLTITIPAYYRADIKACLNYSNGVPLTIRILDSDSIAPSTTLGLAQQESANYKLSSLCTTALTSSGGADKKIYFSAQSANSSNNTMIVIVNLYPVN